MANLEALQRKYNNLQVTYNNLVVNKDVAFVRFLTVASLAGVGWFFNAPALMFGAGVTGLLETLYNKNKREAVKEKKDALQKQILSAPPPAPVNKP